jgi:hypothetical protein
MDKRRFKVGDRVRIVRSVVAAGQWAVGKETTILGLYSFGPDWQFRGDAYVIDVAPNYAALDCELEPLYDGNQPAKWKDCVWTPSKTTV